MNELGASLGTAYQDQPVSTIYVGPGHGAYAAFQLGAANAMGYDDLKVIEASRFLRSVTEQTPNGATLEDAVHTATAVDAMAQSAQTRTWIHITTGIA
jgi:predicted dehydrogenase